MIIEAGGLRKTFKVRGQEIEAVRGVDLQVREGEIFGFLGPNGAGKTTTVRMLATLIPPTAGRVRLAGYELPKEFREARKQIGYVGQAGGVDDGMTVRDNLVLQARIAGLSRADATQRTVELLTAMDLVELADRPGRTLSGGQRRRLGLALGLVNRPALLFLDEPTLGLDPAARAGLWREVRALRDNGTSVFLTTHYLDEADVLCDRLAIIDRGLIVADGTPAELKQSVVGDVISIALDDVGDDVREIVSGLDFTREVRDEPGGLRAYVSNGRDAVPVMLRRLDERGIAVRSVGLESPSLDDVFLRQTGQSMRPTAEATPQLSGWNGGAR